VGNQPVKERPLIEARNLGFHYDRHPFVFRSIDLDLHKGEFLAVLGASGCGKTSLLKVLGGFLTPVSGTVLRQGIKIDRPSPEAVMVFQEFDQLFPWKRVWSNVAFPLKTGKRGLLRTVDKTEGREGINERVDHILKEVGLYEYRRYFPYQLSGGMKQRTALARALVCRPPLLLMDEPFGSLDAQKREELQGLLLRMWGEHGFSVIFVTHDISEALILADKILVMRPPPSSASGTGSGPGGGEFMLLGVDMPRPRSPRDGMFRKEYQRVFKLLGPETEQGMARPGCGEK